MEAPDDTRHAIARDRRDFYADRRRTGEYLRHAATKSGRRPMSLVGEFLQLRRGRGRLTFPEYVQYGVYDTARIGHEEQSRFIANNLHWPMTRTCCDMTFQAVTEDKWLCSKTLSGSDVPVPETLAVIDRGERSYPGTRKISTVDELREFSLSPGSLPFFAKENRGICSWGAMLALEADQDRIHIRNEGWIDYRTLLDECMGETPYLLQRVERNHEFLDRYADALATVRLCILLSDDGFKVPFAVLKLPSGKHVADNFWRPGNLACAVDPETGTVLTVRTKNALGTTDYREHPGTGEALAEERLPMWDRVLAIAERASWVFEPVRYQSMDIAIGDDGPVLVEANTGGGSTCRNSRAAGVSSPTRSSRSFAKADIRDSSPDTHGEHVSMHPIPHAAEPVPPTAAAEILAMLQSGDLFRYSADGNAPVTRLEKAFAEFMGAPFALAVNSCSSAIFLSLKTLGLGSGERVLMPAFTFAAVPSAVLHAGCTPVLANIGPDLRLDIEDFERNLTSDIHAVLLSHMRGHTSDMDAVMRLCQARDIPVIEDAAHSLGATWSGQKVGTIGRIGCFSFQSYKLVNAGEGGMLVSRDPDLVARAIIMSGAYEHNWKKHAIVNDRFRHWQNRLPLYGLRMNNLSAAVALSQIDDIPRRARKGRENHDYLATGLIASGWFDVPASLPQECRAPDSIQFTLNGLDTEERAADFRRLADERGVQVEIFGRSRDNARAFWNWGFLDPQPGLSPTRAVLERTCDVRLPVQMDKPSLDSVVEALVGAAQSAAAAKSPACWQGTPQSATALVGSYRIGVDR